MSILKIALNIALAVLAFSAITQVRKPNRLMGRFFLWIMNLSHSGVTDWGLEHISIDRRATILDVGCGGGRTIQKLAAAAAEGRVYGVDYATGSVAGSRAKNADLVERGRVGIVRAGVSQLPFPDRHFDLVTAVETQYYWPDLVNDMREVRRVLKPGGTLLVIAETHRRGPVSRLQAPMMKLIRAADMSADDQRRLFEQSGFAEVQIFEKDHGGWICATGKG